MNTRNFLRSESCIKLYRSASRERGGLDTSDTGLLATLYQLHTSFRVEWIMNMNDEGEGIEGSDRGLL
jgi:hypothetical protein